MKGFALGLTLKQMWKATWKWPICLNLTNSQVVIIKRIHHKIHDCAATLYGGQTSIWQATRLVQLSINNTRNHIKCVHNLASLVADSTKRHCRSVNKTTSHFISSPPRNPPLHFIPCLVCFSLLAPLWWYSIIMFQGTGISTKQMPTTCSHLTCDSWKFSRQLNFTIFKGQHFATLNRYFGEFV